MSRPVISQCDTPKCGARIFFVVIANQAGRKPRLMPLDAEPDPGGNVAAYQDETGTWRGRVLGKGQPAPHETLYCPHFATCTDPGAHRRRQKDAWRRAESGHKAAQRNRRGGPRPAAQPQPGMFRIPGGHGQ